MCAQKWKIRQHSTKQASVPSKMVFDQLIFFFFFLVLVKLVVKRVFFLILVQTGCWTLMNI